MMNNLSAGAIVGTAVALGVVHVLSGADHLSAVVTLSANVPPKRAFLMGVRWGIGHSIGLLLIGSIFIAITVGSTEETIELPHAVEKVFESLVGVFMLLLGAFGMRRAWYKWQLRKQEQEDEREKAAAVAAEAAGGDSVAAADVEGAALPVDSATPLLLLPEDAEASSGVLDVPPAVAAEEGDEVAVVEDAPLPVTTLLARGSYDNTDEEQGGGVVGPTSTPTDLLLDEVQKSSPELGPSVEVPGDAISSAAAASLPKEQPEGMSLRGDGDDNDDDVLAVAEPPRRGCCGGRCRNFTPQRITAGWIALCMGIVHGLAGPGGVLGVIPAVQLHDWKLAILYLLTFCITSTFIMGVFGLVYGTLSSKIGGSALRREFWIEFLSACLSVAVGIIWLVLIPLDLLDDIFG